MSLNDLRARYKEGLMTKAEYIDQMHELHAKLFSYAHFLEETEIGSIELESGRVVMITRTSGIKVICNPQDKRTAPVEALNFGSYEAEFVAAVCKLISGQGVILDIGANIGWYSLQISKRFPKIEIHAFEPIPDTYAQLSSNIEINGFKNITAHNLGLSNVSEVKTFFYEPDCSGRASGANLADSQNAQKLQCKVTPLDEFPPVAGKDIQFIKCDCEGAELFVLQGAAQTLKRSKPAVFCEMLRKWSAKFGYHPNDILQLMKSHGYSAYVLRNGRLARFVVMDDNTKDTNFFFLHDTNHRDLALTFGR